MYTGDFEIPSTFYNVNQLNQLCRNYQLPDCQHSVRLHLDFHPATLLNTTVEVFGEVRLFNQAEEFREESLESAFSLIQKLGNLQQSLEESRGLPARPPSGTNDKSLHPAVKGKLQKEIEEFKKRYKPVIQVHTMKHIQEAREIIAENLQYRLIQKYKKNRGVI